MRKWVGCSHSSAEASDVTVRASYGEVWMGSTVSLEDASSVNTSLGCLFSRCLCARCLCRLPHTSLSGLFFYLSTLDLLLLAPPNCFLKLTSDNFEQLRNTITICYTLLTIETAHYAHHFTAHFIMQTIHYRSTSCKLHTIDLAVKLLPACSRCNQDKSTSPRLTAMLTLLYNSAEKPFYFDRSPLHKMQCLTLTPENSAHKTQHDH